MQELRRKALEDETKIHELKDGYKMLLDQNELLKYDKSELEIEKERVLAQCEVDKKALSLDIEHLNSQLSLVQSSNRQFEDLSKQNDERCDDLISQRD